MKVPCTEGHCIYRLSSGPSWQAPNPSIYLISTYVVQVLLSKVAKTYKGHIRADVCVSTKCRLEKSLISRQLCFVNN